MNRHATVAVSIGAISAPCGLLQRERLVVLVVTSVPCDDVGRRRRVKGTFRSHSGGWVQRHTCARSCARVRSRRGPLRTCRRVTLGRT